MTRYGQLANCFTIMEKNSLLKEITDYCAAANISPSTLGVRALGNSRFLDRLERKLEKLTEDEASIRHYMRNNPPQVRDASSAVADG